MYPEYLFQGVLVQISRDEDRREEAERAAKEKEAKRQQKHLEMITNKDMKNTLLAGRWALSTLTQAPSVSTSAPTSTALSTSTSTASTRSSSPSGP